MSQSKISPLHPGEVLLEEFLKPLGISQNKIAIDLAVSPRRINEIVLGKRRITADTALRLAHYFNMSAEFWMGLQTDFDLETEADQLGEKVSKEVKIYAEEYEIA